MPDQPAPSALPRVLTADPSEPAGYAAALDQAAEIIRAGGLVAFPTETVYGLGANALSAQAVRRIFAAKGRPPYNPVIVHIADAAEVRRVARDFPAMAERLATAFWPGPLTLVLPRGAAVPDEVTAGLDGVGVRVPAHPVARDLIARAGLPIAAPSANPFTRVSPTTAAHVAAQLGSAVDLILDGGPSSVGIESTVVDVTGQHHLLLRPGGVSREALERVVGPVGTATLDPGGDAPRPSPGMIERHYAPRARLEPIESGNVDALNRRVDALIAAGERVAVIGRQAPNSASALYLPMPDDAERYAQSLYATLHTLDAAGCTVALLERPPRDRGGSWEAIADRLRRAGLPPSP